LKQAAWHNKISNSAQLGGIESSVLDNGAGRGPRIAWFNTGSGLRFKIVIDRAMDIADAFYNEHSLAWISHAGTSNAQPLADKGIDWLRTFGGGLMVTCGLSHVGGPEKDEYGERRLIGLSIVRSVAGRLSRWGDCGNGSRNKTREKQNRRKSHRPNARYVDCNSGQ
jgi:hypothetical protein